jgi:hypothetical protein
MSITYLILRQQLANIMSRIVDQRQRLDQTTAYTDVWDIQAKLMVFAENLPRQFAVHDADTSYDSSKCHFLDTLTIGIPWLAVHRYFLLSELQVLTMFLHVSVWNVPYLIFSETGYYPEQTASLSHNRLRLVPTLL